MRYTPALPLIALLLALPLRPAAAQCSGCEPGARVRITGALELVDDRHTRIGSRAVGALLGQAGDTIRLQVPGRDSVRVFLRGPETELAPALPQDPSDPVLPGDAFRIDGHIRRARQVDRGAVTFRDAPESAHPLKALYAPGSSAERLVHRPSRPVYYIAATSAGIAGAVALFVAFDRELEDDEWASLVEGPPLLMLTAVGAAVSVGAGIALGRILGREKDEWRSLASADPPTWSVAPAADGSVMVRFRLRH